MRIGAAGGGATGDAGGLRSGVGFGVCCSASFRGEGTAVGAAAAPASCVFHGGGRGQTKTPSGSVPERRVVTSHNFSQTPSDANVVLRAGAEEEALPPTSTNSLLPVF